MIFSQKPIVSKINFDQYFADLHELFEAFDGFFANDETHQAMNTKPVDVNYVQFDDHPV